MQMLEQRVRGTVVNASVLDVYLRDFIFAAFRHSQAHSWCRAISECPSHAGELE
jgi:hypothetical protein